MAEEEVSDEFIMIPHCGGKVTFEYEATEGGGRSVSATYSSDRPLPMAMFGVWALPSGHIVGTSATGWSGPGVPQPPSRDAFQVQIASDRETMFGRQCRSCNRYFRTNSAPFLWRQTCPYCGSRAETHYFTTPAQIRYVHYYVQKMFGGFHSDAESITIDLDEISDAAAKGLAKPTYYYEGEKQQLKFKCEACKTYTDVLGHNAYCCCCGTKNNISILKGSLETIKRQASGHAKPSDLLKLAISEFEACGRDYVEQLTKWVPATPKRKQKATSIRFHDVERFSRELREVFDIDPQQGISADELEFVRVRFFRRNLYEHRGGIVDQEYIDLSGDQKRLGQALRENEANVRNLCDIAAKMAKNIHDAFHLILPPEKKALEILSGP
jgi:Zn finger protein HypA/HybF involved in hydrogenase expression